ncbi:MAG: Fic family protein [Bryobacteraceae bacterium]|nr:Fic family protein [Bryobacteraceae bacterium]
MQYEHIQRLGQTDLALADSEIPALKRVIENYREFLSPESWSAFQTRVAREWAIETGQIEGLYQFDRGLTITLIEDGFTVSRIPPTSSQMSPEQVAAILNDHLTALEALFAFVKGDRPLSKSYIHELHQALLRNQKSHTVYAMATRTFFEKELVAGRYKDQPNNPTRPDGSVLHFCPPEQVEAEMDQLIQGYREHENEGLPIELQAAWLHHAFTHIHPYPDGNGRVARALATLVLIKGGLMPLVVPTTEKQSVYIPVLEEADQHDYSPLVAAIRRWQGRLVVDLSQRVEFKQRRDEAATIDELMEAIRTDLLCKDLSIPEPWKAQGRIAGLLSQAARSRLHEVTASLSKVAPNWHFRVSEDAPTDLRDQFANYGFAVQSPGPAGTLWLNTPTPCKVYFFSGVLGPKPRGLGVFAVGFEGPNNQHELLGHPFLTTFAEEEDLALARFKDWFEKLVTRGLNRWREINLM